MTHADDLMADIETARAELADTVDQLAYRLDVRAQLKRKTAELRAKAREARTPALAVAGGTAVLLVALIVLRRRR